MDYFLFWYIIVLIKNFGCCFLFNILKKIKIFLNILQKLFFSTEKRKFLCLKSLFLCGKKRINHEKKRSENKYIFLSGFIFLSLGDG